MFSRTKDKEGTLVERLQNEFDSDQHQAIRVFRTDHQSRYFAIIPEVKAIDLCQLVVASWGLGDPEHFELRVVSMGARSVVQTMTLPDHTDDLLSTFG